MEIDKSIYQYQKKLTPPDGLCYSGAGQSIEAIFAMQKTLPEDKKPVIIALYERLGIEGYIQSPDIMEAHNLFPGAILQIGLQLPDHNPEYLRIIASGRLDAELKKMAVNYKSIRLPIILRIGYEPDGEWNSYDPSLYVAVFRRIVDFIRLEGAHNVEFFVNSYIPNNRDFFQWYPGDDYVDWVGYNTMQPVFDAEWFCREAALRRKPLMIGESSYAIMLKDNPDMTFSEWALEFFQSLKAYNIKGFQYINWVWALYPVFVNWKGWQNGRYTDDPDKVKIYNSFMDDAFIYRGRDFYQPLRLFVHCARNLREEAVQQNTWDQDMDHFTGYAGFDYCVENASCVYGNGFTCHWKSTGNSLKVNLSLPHPMNGYIIFEVADYGCRTDQIIQVVVNTKVFRVVWRTGGYIKVPVTTEDTKGLHIEMIIRSLNGPRISQFGLIEISEQAPQAFDLTKKEVDGGIQLSWEATAAHVYNIYRDWQLIGMSDTNSYCIPGSSMNDVFSVSACDFMYGEGPMFNIT